MKIIRFPKKENLPDLLIRPVFEVQSLDERIKAVIDDVRKNGDAALINYTKKFDQVELKALQVREDEIAAAEKNVDKKLKQAMEVAIKNISKFHSAQQSKPVEIETMEGVKCWQKSVPVEKVGLYIPGGTAPLFSTVLMLAIPARIAGCSEVILCSPPGKNGKLNPAIIYAATAVGVTEIFKVGGAQAIAAMAYGTETIPAVYKIFGPGNQYVTAAKQLVARNAVAIDMPAGPSEVAVLADDSSNPAYIASDLLSQAEHGPDSQVILISVSENMIERSITELEKQLAALPRKQYAEMSLNHSKAFLVNNYREMIDIVNSYAPEHLIISTSNADDLAEQVRNAGSVFIGEYTPESAGDYASGTNHTLPTNGNAVAYSGVNLDAYMKKITFQKITKEGLRRIGPAVEIMAEAEELTAHQRAVSKRIK